MPPYNWRILKDADPARGEIEQRVKEMQGGGQELTNQHLQELAVLAASRLSVLFRDHEDVLLRGNGILAARHACDYVSRGMPRKEIAGTTLNSQREFALLLGAALAVENARGDQQASRDTPDASVVLSA